jgi:hypothetical protein
MQPNQPYYPVSEKHLFPIYFSAAAYQAATGKEAPVFNPARKQKNWFDPGANPASPFILIYSVYAQAEKGEWKCGQIGMSAEEAGSLNILPDSGPLHDHPPGTGIWGVPASPLLPNEQLFPTIGNVLLARRIDLAPASQNDSFTLADRELLRAIAQKVGVEVQYKVQSQL